MRVWIEKHACVGNGICAEVCPEVFGLADGDIAYVHDRGRPLPSGADGALAVPVEAEEAVLEAADECPVACIYVEDA